MDGRPPPCSSHGSWPHLTATLWFLWILGNNVEDSSGAPPLPLSTSSPEWRRWGAGLGRSGPPYPLVGASGATSWDHGGGTLGPLSQGPDQHALHHPSSSSRWLWVPAWVMRGLLVPDPVHGRGSQPPGREGCPSGPISEASWRESFLVKPFENRNAQQRQEGPAVHLYRARSPRVGGGDVSPDPSLPDLTPPALTTPASSGSSRCVSPSPGRLPALLLFLMVMPGPPPARGGSLSLSGCDGGWKLFRGGAPGKTLRRGAGRGRTRGVRESAPAHRGVHP